MNKKEYWQKWYAENKERLSARRKTGHANQTLSNAIFSGKIKRGPCEVCGAEKAEAHHDDYNKPLEVRWLCKKCHIEWHKHNKPKYLT